MAAQSMVLSTPSTPLGSLATFPLEIRRMIYSLALASSYSLIGTSRAIKEETLPMLYEHGIQRFRIKFDRTIVLGFPAFYFEPPTWRKSYTTVNHPGWRLDEEDQALIQNISITVDMVEPHSLHRGPRVCAPRSSLFHTL